MFAKAVQQQNLQEQNSATAHKGSSLSQLPRTVGRPLKPSAPTALNSFWPAAGNSLKRTATQANAEELSMTRQDSIMSSNSFGGLSQGSSNEGRVGKLHGTVYFDENDFEDDADIDLDAEEPPFLKSSSLSQISQSSPPMPSRAAVLPEEPLASSAAVPPEEPPASSAAVAWSSSPLQHKLPPSPKEAARASTSKRRRLPWQHEGVRQAPAAPAVSSSAQSIIARHRAHLPADRGDEGSSTPLPKDKSHSPYLWNKTASAVKEEQKHLRQGNRKLVESKGANDKFPSQLKVGFPRVCLSEEQRKVLNLVTEENKSVFFTGSAGTGKSILLREIIKTLRGKYKSQPDRVAVTASTGLAACNVGGVTLHSFAGIGLGKEDIPFLVKKIKRNQKGNLRWLRTKVLIIDEISMVDGELFDKLEGIARTIRNNGRPFGGIQLVITGDFFQLPPVPDSGKVAKFAFDAATWNTSIAHTIGLTKVFRQKDPHFANMLNEMRLGKLSPQSIEEFRSLNRPLAFHDDFEATELFPTRYEVDNANSVRMRNLGGKAFEYRAEDGGSIKDLSQREKLLSNCMAAPLITLKKGSQVMLIKNIDETLVNGSVGKVIAFMDEKMFDIYHENEESFQAPETMDLNDEDGSRKKLKAMMSRDLVADTSRQWPLVRFALADGSSRDLLCQRESWKIELPNGEVQASRAQIPLILAWALSIHKAQGQTLERVKVDLGKIFEKGQAYVALSRATCQEGLQVLRFDPKKVMAHEKVRNFYDSLYSIDDARRSTDPSLRGAPKTAVTTVAKEFEQAYFHTGLDSDDDNDALQEIYR